MAGVDKVPGMRKNGPPVPDDDVSLMTDEQLVDALNEETQAWARAGLDPMRLTHDMNAMDVQVQTIVWTLIELGIVDEDSFNRKYRERMLEKLRSHRSMITRAQITHGAKPPPGIIIPGR